MKNQGLRWLKLLAIAMLALPAFAAHPASAQADCRTFPETGHQVCGTFLTYWNNNGALAQQGYPITEPVSETSDTDGKIYTVQYFERAVFEEHPEFAGTQNEVLLQLLGVFFYQSRYPGGATGQTPNAEANSQLFPETGHKVGGTFLAYWTSHGALRQQGYPISDEFTEVNQLDSKPYKVQYFERAVFEYHPEFAGTPNEVLLSQLGTFQNTRKHSAPTPVPPAATATTAPSQPTSTTAPPPPPPAATATTAPADPCAGLPAANPDVITIPVSRCGPAGTAFGWTAKGFHPNENVGVYITLPDGGVAGAPFQVSTDDQGYVIDGVTFGTRSDFPLGRYAITFEGVDSHITKIEYFKLIP
jgi:hypothetical protein